MNEFAQKLSSDVISGTIPFESVSLYKDGNDNAFKINNILFTIDIHPFGGKGIANRRRESLIISKVETPESYAIVSYSNEFITKILVFSQDKHPEDFTVCKTLWDFIANKHFSETAVFHSANCGLLIDFQEIFNKNLRSICITDCVNNKLNYINRHTIESNFKLAFEKTKLDMKWK